MPKNRYFNFFEDVDDIDDVFWESKQQYPQIQWQPKASSESPNSCCHIAPTVPQVAADPTHEPMEIGGQGGREGQKDFSGIQIELIEATKSTIPSASPIVFNVVASQAGCAITYNDTTGIVTISQKGYYLVNWWVSIDATSLTSNVILSLNKNGGTHSQASSLPMTGQISGSALIPVEFVPTTLSITNISGADITLGNVRSQAGMVVFSAL